MATLILSPRYTDDSIRLRRTALAQGWQVERLQNYRVPAHLSGADVALYGEALFTTIIAEQLDITLLDCPEGWLAEVPEAYLLREVRYTTLQDARSAVFPCFVKPATGKSFEAQVYQSAEALPSADHQDDKAGVYIAEPVQWSVEFRCFVHQRQIMTMSPYKGEAVDETTWTTSPETTADALNFCEQFLADTTIALPEAIVLDVGYLVGRGWAVLETNPVWAAGIYGCESVKVLPLLQAACNKKAPPQS